MGNGGLPVFSEVMIRSKFATDKPLSRFVGRDDSPMDCILQDLVDDAGQRGLLRSMSKTEERKRVFVPAEAAHPRGRLMAAELIANQQRVLAFFIQYYGSDAPLACEHCKQSYRENVTKGGREHFTFPYHICRILPGMDIKCGNCRFSDLPCDAGSKHAFAKKDERDLNQVFAGKKGTSFHIMSDWLESLDACPRIMSTDFVGWGREDRESVELSVKAAIEKLPKPKVIESKAPSPTYYESDTATPKKPSSWSKGSVPEFKLKESFSSVTTTTPAAQTIPPSLPAASTSLAVSKFPRQTKDHVYAARVPSILNSFPLHNTSKRQMSSKSELSAAKPVSGRRKVTATRSSPLKSSPQSARKLAHTKDDDYTVESDAENGTSSGDDYKSSSGCPNYDIAESKSETQGTDG